MSVSRATIQAHRCPEDIYASLRKIGVDKMPLAVPGSHLYSGAASQETRPDDVINPNGMASGIIAGQAISKLGVSNMGCSQAPHTISTHGEMRGDVATRDSQEHHTDTREEHAWNGYPSGHVVVGDCGW